MKDEETDVAVITERMLEQWKRGVLSFWVLGLLLIRPMYGLEVKKEIEGRTQGKMKLGVSTIYQLLRRMERKGLVKSWQERTTHGPPRAYYDLTAEGREVVCRYHRFIAEVLAPESPVLAALSELGARILQQIEINKRGGEQPIQGFELVPQDDKESELRPKN